VTSRQIDARPFVTHRFGKEEVLTAYDVFDRASETDALKVVINP
jgi:alcohol dehydrogenase